MGAPEQFRHSCSIRFLETPYTLVFSVYFLLGVFAGQMPDSSWKMSQIETEKSLVALENF
jgi:hypothetical protein